MGRSTRPSGGSSRPGQERRADRPDDPYLPEEIEISMLDREVRARLRGLSKENAERVGRHLVMTGRLLEVDPELAYEHAQAAVRRAARIDVVREALALAAYATSRYAEALRELRTVRRLSGVDSHRALEADAERGLGRPERAIALYQQGTSGLAVADRIELALVASGARLDLGEPEAAYSLLDSLTVPGRFPELAVRVEHAKVPVLRALGRDDEAAALDGSLGELSHELPDTEVFVIDLEDDAVDEPFDPDDDPTSDDSVPDDADAATTSPEPEPEPESESEGLTSTDLAMDDPVEPEAERTPPHGEVDVSVTHPAKDAPLDGFEVLLDTDR